MGRFGLRRRRTSGSPAFTLIEAMVAMTITGLAASALLLGVQSSLQHTDAAIEETIALGLAEQMMDEVLGSRYTESMLGASITPGYLLGKIPFRGFFTGSRQYYNRLDDYQYYVDYSVSDPYGVQLGTEDGEGGERHPDFQVPSSYLSGWARLVEVYYVSDDDLQTRLPAGQRGNCRAVHVGVLRYVSGSGWREVADLTRVVGYVDPE